MISSQAAAHARFGGVVPEVASRHHLELVNPVVDAALAEAGVELGDVDSIAVTRGPGLIGALLVGVSTAKALAAATGKPLVGVDHLHGHVAANFLEPEPLEPPFLCLIASGGHTLLAGVRDARRATRCSARPSTTPPARRSTRRRGCSASATRAGRRSSARPRDGDPEAFAFPVAMTNDPRPRLQLQRPQDGAPLRGPRARRPTRPRERRADLAASFQAAVVDQLVAKLAPGARRRRANWRGASRSAAASPPTRCCASASRELCERDGLELKLVARELCTDNAAMIASAARFLEPAPYPELPGLGRPWRDSTVVTLYGRPGCHLCDEARDGLEALRCSAPDSSCARSTSSPTIACSRAMLERIPVVEVDGGVVSELEFDLDAFARRLAYCRGRDRAARSATAAPTEAAAPDGSVGRGRPPLARASPRGCPATCRC